MTQPPWVWMVAGTVVTLGATAAFLAALAHGLKRGRWWPVGLIVIAWLVATVGYLLWDNAARQAAGRQRVSGLETITSNGILSSRVYSAITRRSTSGSRQRPPTSRAR